MSLGVLGTRWGTHLLFMVAEFTLFVLFFDFAAVHSGSFSFSARTLFFFSSFSCRLSLLLRCLLLLLQDSAFPLILYKDRRQTNSPPLSNCPELPDTLATSMKCPRLNGRKVAGEWAVRGGVGAVRYSSPFPGKSCSGGLLSLNGFKRSGGLRRRQTSLLSSPRRGGMEGGVSRVG